MMTRTTTGAGLLGRACGQGPSQVVALNYRRVSKTDVSGMLMLDVAARDAPGIALEKSNRWWRDKPAGRPIPVVIRCNMW
jgi:hypothetical protein